MNQVTHLEGGITQTQEAMSTFIQAAKSFVKEISSDTRF